MGEGESQTTHPDRPSVSVVVASHARPEFLVESVKSIAADMDNGDELVVVACCNSEAAAALAGLAVPIRYLPSPHAGKCAKLNTGIRAACGEVILFTDDDCRVPTGWVEAMVGPFADCSVGMAFGPVTGLTSFPGGSSLPAIPPGPAPPELWNYAHGASMAVRRSTATAVGGFDERLGPGTPARSGEEPDLVLRALAQGWTCEIADAPPVDHLDWRGNEESMSNLFAYQRGSGVYLGAGLRRRPSQMAKPLLLRMGHEAAIWRDWRSRSWTFVLRMTAEFAAGLARGSLIRPRRLLAEPSAPPARGGRPRVLWVTDEPPDRRQGGGNIRQAMLLDALADRFDVTLLLVGRLSDVVTRRRIDRILELPRPRIVPARNIVERRARDLANTLARRQPSEAVQGARIRRSLRPVLNGIADEFDLVIVHHLYLAPLLPTRRRARWLLHLFDVASERARHELANEPGRRQRWLLSRQAAKAARYEQEMSAAYDGLIAVTERDAVAVQKPAGRSAPVILVPNGINSSELTPTPVPPDHNVLLPGTLNYRPNVLGAIWFCTEVLPLIQPRVPDVHLDLVGRQPVEEVVALAQLPAIDLHADVPTMTPWLSGARVVVVPLRIGTGTRLKALEAMAAGRPVVGTTIGLEGLGVVDGEHVRVADDPAAMANAVVDVLISNTLAESLAAAGRRHVEERFQWGRLGEQFANALEETASRGRLDS